MHQLFKLLFLVSLIIPLCLGSCKADIDLHDVDMSASMESGIAMPIGTISATIGDFFGSKEGIIFVDSLNHRGVLTVRDTFSWEKNYHDVDLSQYISSKALKMDVYDKIGDLPYVVDHKITGNDNLPLELVFPLTLRLNGINKDLSFERLDKALIRDAQFISNVNRDNLPLDWEWIDSITIDLGSNIHRPAGNIECVYRKGDTDENGDAYTYGKDIPINVDEFEINLMKNKDLDESQWQWFINNVVDSCTFEIHFHFKVPTSAGVVTIPAGAAFHYNLSVQFIDYYAIWGMFKPSPDMSDENIINLAEEWPFWRKMEKAILPFADPIIDAYITTTIAGALRLDECYIYSSNATETQPATFDGKEKMPKTILKNYLPLKSNIGDSAVMTIRFDKDEERGRIDKLFAIHPEKLAYNFNVNFDQESTPQIRILPHTGIRMDAVATLPLIFNKGTYIAYEDTIRNVDLSKMTLNSLLANSPMIDTIECKSLVLALRIQNGIPLQVKAIIEALDENGNRVPNPGNPTDYIRLTQSDTILLPTPTYHYENNSWHIEQLSESIQTIQIKQEQIDSFSKIKQIRIMAIIDEGALQDAYNRGFQAAITEDNKLKFTIGVGANVKAIFNLSNLSNQNK